MDTNNTDSPSTFSHLASAVIHVFEKKDQLNTEPKINVNRFVSELAAWYEKLRNAMDYRDDEVVLRAAIERILKRRLLINGNPSKIAEPLVRELVWARYFPTGTVPESMVSHVSSYIMLYMELKQHIHRHG